MDDNYTPPRHDEQQQGYAPTGPPQVIYYPAPPPTNGLAIAGFVVSFFCAIVGLVLSLVALSQINNSKIPLGGKGLAIAGMVISLVGLLFWITYLIVWAVVIGSVGAAAAAMGGGF